MALRKIALVCDWYHPRLGGIEVQLRGLAAQLVRHGYGVEIVTTEPGPGEVDGVPVHRLKVSRRRRWLYMAGAPVLRDLQEALETGPFDLVHAHSVYSPLALGALRVARRLGMASVLTNHSMLVDEESWLFSALNACFAWGRDADVITAVSGAAAGATRRVTGREDIRVIPNGIDLRAWQRPKVPHERLRVTTVLRLTRRKRPIDLVRTVPRVLELLPAGLDPVFTVVGCGPERARLEAEVARLGVEHNVELSGGLDQQHVSQVLAGTDLFVLPTVREAFSIASLEARCAGVPVVAMNHGGVGHVIEDGVHGFLTMDLQQFAQRIALLLGDAGLRNQMGQAAGRHLARFVWSRVVRETLDAYRAALALHREESPRGLKLHAVRARP